MQLAHLMKEKLLNMKQLKSIRRGMKYQPNDMWNHFPEDYLIRLINSAMMALMILRENTQLYSALEEAANIASDPEEKKKIKELRSAISNDNYWWPL